MTTHGSAAAKARAIELLASDATVLDVATEIGCTKRTLYNWKNDPEFNRAIDTAKAAVFAKRKATARTAGLSDLEITLLELKERHARCKRIIAERAADEKMQEAPGGQSGLLTVTYKMQSMGKDEGQQLIPEYRVDAALLAEMREIEVQIQTHLGTWRQKTEVRVTGIMSVMERLAQGRKRNHAEKVARDQEKAKLDAGSPSTGSH